MKRLFSSLKRNKEKGSVGVEALMVFCISLLMFMVLLVIVITAFGNINNKWKIKQCAREYLLIAESQGCLTSEDVSNMTTELNSYGLTNVVFQSDTTTERAEYGDPVVIHFVGTYINNTSDIGTLGGFLGVTTFTENLEITRRSTSKW